MKEISQITKNQITEYVMNAIHPYASQYGKEDMSINEAVNAIIMAMEIEYKSL